MKIIPNDYVIRVLESPLDVSREDWNGLLASQRPDGVLHPFLRHEYLAALHTSGSAVPDTGWTPRFMTLWQGDKLVAACCMYLKAHSYGEYVFDHAWANAFHQHGLEYYPKALVAVPFTPVPGTRLLARTSTDRIALLEALTAWCGEERLSSLHLLFTSDEDTAACKAAGLMLRHTVQFHWSNQQLATPATDTAAPRPAPIRFTDFDDFLSSLNQEKRKKIRQERRKVTSAGIIFRWARGRDINDADWDLFYRCYSRTYYEHGNAPYLSRAFFHHMQRDMPENWVLFIAEYTDPQGDKHAIATSLIAVESTPVHPPQQGSDGTCNALPGSPSPKLTAYGRYWGALARVDCLHFEACYYQPLEWCIANDFHTFEGGAQGEHKMARALLPVKTTSAHWVRHPSFSDAIESFLSREGTGIDRYVNELEQRTPFKQT